MQLPSKDAEGGAASNAKDKQSPCGGKTEILKKMPFKTTWRGQYILVKDGKTEFPLTADSVNMSALA